MDSHSPMMYNALSVCKTWEEFVDVCKTNEWNQAVVRSEHTLCRLVANGHGGIAEWLVDHFGLTAEDARAEDNDALCHCVAGGHTKTAKWFVDHFNLAAEDARCDDNLILRLCAENGHTETTK